MPPGAIGSSCSASRTGRPLMRVRCSASTVVKVGGMCWVIKIGARSIVLPICPISEVSACGPPVEEPIQKRARPRHRKRPECQGRAFPCRHARALRRQLDLDGRPALAKEQTAAAAEAADLVE